MFGRKAKGDDESSHEDVTNTVAEGTSSGVSGKFVLPPPQAVQDPRTAADGAPEWMFPIIKKSINQVALVVLLILIAIYAFRQASGLISVLFFAFFLALAMTPAVTWLNQKKGWSRGAAAGSIFLGLILTLAAFIGLLIPMTVTMASKVSNALPTWAKEIDGRFHTHIADFFANPNFSSASLLKYIKGSTITSILHLATSGIGALFNIFTLLMFTFLFAVSLPGMERAILGRLKPSMQVRVGWAWDSAIQQTGGYFYSRLLLLVINGTLFLFVMVLVGMPWYFAVPLSYFQAFFAEFIPVVGTYIGIAIPVALTLGFKGWIAAVVLLGWAIVYQQIENYWLSPKFASNTMDINAGLAFGAALFGGAVGGAIGAVVAMPIAGMVTAFVKHFARQYPLVYESVYDTDAMNARKAQADTDPPTERPTDEQSAQSADEPTA